jgi:DNA (cytosine-5)-methyltransferase 1
VTRAPVIRTLLGDGIVVDNFAGGGGVSEGFARALGRAPHHAINHDEEALAMHAVNHPETQHHVADVWDVNPAALCGGRRVAAAWFSPDCKDHSTAKGGKPVDKRIRALAWVAVRWARAVKPGIIYVENVPEFVDWGPLHRTHSEGCEPSRDHDGDIVCSLVRCQFNRRIAHRKGEIFRRFIHRLRQVYRHVEWRVLRACDYGSPTSRRRLFIQASDETIAWPRPTHGPASTGRPKRWRTAAECVDWSIPMPSIFLTREEARAYERETGIRCRRPLADNTLHRIGAGVVRHVLESARPFLIPVGHGAKGDGPDRRSNSINDPMPTITAGRRGDHALVAPVLIQTGQGERKGQRPRYLDIGKPLGTVVACGGRHALAAGLLVPFIENGNSARRSGGWNITRDLNEPFPTITTQRQKAVIAAHLMKFQGTSSAHLNSCSSSLGAPVPAITADGWKLAQVAAFLVRYNGESGPQALDEPLGTLDTNDRYGVVTVVIDGVTWAIADILMRMFVPRELARATGFRDDYVLDPVVGGARLSRTAQIRMIGNSVPPDIVDALVSASFPQATARREPLQTDRRAA